MKACIFVDASAWCAIADTNDSRHEHAARALALFVAQRVELITSNLVLAEAYTIIRYKLGHTAAVSFLQRTRDGAFLRRAQIVAEWEEAAEDLLQQFGDQDFSYVDATSFIAMRRLRIAEAFTFDHHFLVAGFSIVPGYS